MKKAFTWMVLLSCISGLSAQGISSLDQATDSVMISIVNQGSKYSVEADRLKNLRGSLLLMRLIWRESKSWEVVSLP